jgi:hypothetical protein
MVLVGAGRASARDITGPAPDDLTLLPASPGQTGDDARHHLSAPTRGQPHHPINPTTQAASPLLDLLLTGQVAKLTTLDAAGNDEFGYAVAVSGDAAVVGAYLDDDDGSDDNHSSYIPLILKNLIPIGEAGEAGEAARGVPKNP